MFSSHYKMPTISTSFRQCCMRHGVELGPPSSTWKLTLLLLDTGSTRYTRIIASRWPDMYYSTGVTNEVVKTLSQFKRTSLAFLASSHTQIPSSQLLGLQNLPWTSNSLSMFFKMHLLGTDIIATIINEIFIFIMNSCTMFFQASLK